VTAKLYVIRGSHACRAGMLMLDHKGIEFQAVNLPVGLHPMLVRLHGFPAAAAPRRTGESRPPMLAMLDRLGTVPALKLDGERVQSNHEIARFLDRRNPDPPLFPEGPERRRVVEEAEEWGNEVLQMVARRLTFMGVLHGRDGLVDRARDGRLGPLLWRNDTMRFYGAKVAGRSTFKATPGEEAELLAELPALLDRVDGYIADGVLNAENLNAADFMIAPSLALFFYRRDLLPEVEGRPLEALVDRLLPEPARVGSPA
jgi:glutathione S-transferase